MSEPINFEFHRFMKVSSAEIAAYVEPLRYALATMQSTDISKLNGRELRKLRDRILNTKRILLVCDPQTRGHILKTLGDRVPEATFEEILGAAPEPVTVKFI